MRRLLLLVALGLCHSVAGAFDYLIADRICIPDAVRIPSFERAPIPVGCELPDCCPGCSPPSVLDWKIKLDARLVTQAELRFEGLAGEELRQLKLGGAARWEGDRILLRAGDAQISGIPNRPGVKVATGMLRPTMSRKAARSIAQQLAPTGTFTDRILVQQFTGAYLVNSFTWDIAIRPCKKPPKPPRIPKDRLKIQGLDPGEEVIVMLDAPTDAGCKQGPLAEWVFPSAGLTIFVENLLSPTTTCRSEVTVFSEKHAMKWQALTWTDLPGDTRTVTLDPLIEEDVYVWIKDETDRTRAEQEVAEAQRLFLENRVGVRLNWKVTKLCDVPGVVCGDPTSPSHPFNIVEAGVSTDGLLCPLGPLPPPDPPVQLAPIRAQPFYVANALNIYYVNVDKAWSGRNCAIADVPFSCITNAWPPYFVKADANITFIGTTESLTTLAHEIGHAYGLRPAVCHGHTEGVPGFGADNIMWTGSTLLRTTFKLGQVFRMNTHADDWGGTMLIPNNSTEPGLSGRVAQPCFPNVSSPACPLLEMDWP